MSTNSSITPELSQHPSYFADALHTEPSVSVTRELGSSGSFEPGLDLILSEMQEFSPLGFSNFEIPGYLGWGGLSGDSISFEPSRPPVRHRLSTPLREVQNTISVASIDNDETDMRNSHPGTSEKAPELPESSVMSDLSRATPFILRSPKSLRSSSASISPCSAEFETPFHDILFSREAHPTAVDIISAVTNGCLDTLPQFVDDEVAWEGISKNLFQELHPDGPICPDAELSISPATMVDHLIDIYFLRFHSSWPILHQTTFRRNEKPSLLVLSVLMIGASLYESNHSILVANRLHAALRSLLYNVSADLRQIRSWSLSLYQADILNIIFGFLSAQRADAIMAEVANGVLVTLIRRLGFFNQEFVASGEETAQIWIYGEEKRRLALAAVKIDSYISVVHNRPPTISYEELAISLPCTQSTWDAQRDASWKIRDQESILRSHSLVSQVVQDVVNNTGDIMPLLEEDYQLILCLIQGMIWRVIKTEALERRKQAGTTSLVTGRFPKGITKESPNSASRVYKILEVWKNHFAVISERKNTPTETSNRVSRVFNSLILWHLDIIRLEADLDLLQSLAGSIKMASEHSKDATSKLFKVKAWARDAQGRASVWHAIQIWSLWDKEISNDPSIVLELIAHIGLFQASVVLWAFLQAFHTCEVCSDASRTASSDNADALEITQVDDSSSLETWLKTGGPASFNGHPLCSCQLPNIMKDFQRLLQRLAPTSGVGNRLAALIRDLELKVEDKGTRA
ncbi:MAG: hypothetical protein M1834_007587 [Cirrosporium novae-zelandiae]|nr:MAG: hypothetical protein M1834_007587 [Cirrosporium novae-zelandiae]